MIRVKCRVDMYKNKSQDMLLTSFHGLRVPSVLQGQILSVIHFGRFSNVKRPYSTMLNFNLIEGPLNIAQMSLCLPQLFLCIVEQNRGVPLLNFETSVCGATLNVHVYHFYSFFHRHKSCNYVRL